ncbi:MAG: hypothetical protein WCO60_18365 [Verrucomicrobiota bacterium]
MSNAQNGSQNVPSVSASVEAEVKLTANASGLNRVLSEVSQNMLHLAGPMLEIANGGSVASAAWNGFKAVIEQKVLGPMAFITPMAAVAARSLRNVVMEVNALARGMDAVARVETLEGQFEPLLKSAEAAKQKVKELQEFADHTPFEFEAVAKAGKNLEVLTRGAYSSKAALVEVGDAAALANVGVDDMATTIGQLYAALKSGRGAGDLTSRLQELGTVSGETRNKIEMLQSGGADVETVFAESWKAVVNDMKRANGQMEVLAKTMSGLRSTQADEARAVDRAKAAPRAEIEKSQIDRQTKESAAFRPIIGRIAEHEAMADGGIEGAKAWVSQRTIQTKTFSEAGKFAVDAMYAAIAGALGAAVVAGGRKLLQLKGAAGGWRAMLKAPGAFLDKSNGARAGELWNKTTSGAEAFIGGVRARTAAHLTRFSSDIGNFGEAEALLRSRAPSDKAAQRNLLNRMGMDGLFSSHNEERQAGLTQVRHLARAERMAKLTSEQRSKIHEITGVEKGGDLFARKYTPAQKGAIRGVYGGTVAEALAATANYNKGIAGAASATQLFVKGVTSGLRVVGGLFTSMLGPLLLWTVAASAVTGVYKFFAGMREARVEAQKTVEAGNTMAKGLLDEARAATTAEGRAQAYQKTLEALADAKREAAAAAKEVGRDIGGNGAVKWDAAKKKVAALEGARSAQRNDLLDATGVSVANQKQYLERVKLERDLMDATEERVEAQLSAEERAASAAGRAMKATRDRVAAEAEYGKKQGVLMSPDYQEHSREAGTDDPMQSERENKERRARHAAAAQEMLAGSGSKVAALDVEIERLSKEHSNVVDARRELSPDEQKNAKVERAAATERLKGLLKRASMQTSRLPSVRLSDEIKEERERIAGLDAKLAPRDQVALGLKQEMLQQRIVAKGIERERAIVELDPEYHRQKEQRALDAVAAAERAKAQERHGRFKEGIEREQKEAQGSLSADYTKNTPESVHGAEYAAAQAAIQLRALNKEKEELERQAGAQRAIKAQFASGNYEGAVEDERAASADSGLLKIKAAPEREAYKKSVMARLAKQREERELAGVSGAGDEGAIERRLAEIESQKKDIGISQRAQQEAGAERQLSQGSSIRAAQMGLDVSKIGDRGFQRQRQEDELNVQQAKKEAAVAKEKFELANGRSGSSLDEESTKITEAFATAPKSEHEGLRQRRVLLDAARAAQKSGTIGDLHADALDKAAGVGIAERRLRDNAADAEQQTGSALRTAQLSGIRRLEGRAQSRDDRDRLRAKGDAIEDRENYERAKIEARGLNLDAAGQEKYAKLQAGKASIERDIERNSRPVVASDLARVGGASAEVAGGDVPRQQLQKLSDIVSAIGQLEKSLGSAGVKKDSGVNPFDTALR